MSKRDPAEKLADHADRAALEIFQSWERWEEEANERELSADEGMMDRIAAAIRRYYPEPVERKANCCCSTCGHEHFSGEVADDERRERNAARRAAYTKSKKPPKKPPKKRKPESFPFDGSDNDVYIKPPRKQGRK